MKINWKIRWDNPQFVANIILSTFIPIFAYLQMEPTDFSSWSSVKDLVITIAKNPYLLIMLLWNFYSAVIDYTVKGHSDSPLVQQKTEPTATKVDVYKGKKEINDSTEILADNTEENNYGPEVY